MESMQASQTPPEDLSERQLFNEYIELLESSSDALDGYEEANIEKRQSALLAEVGERLETLEAIKSLTDSE